MAIGNAIFEEFDICERCGFQFHISQLMKQEGHLRCTVSCVDDLSNKYRQKQIAEVLKGTREGMSDKPEIFRDPGEVVFE